MEKELTEKQQSNSRTEYHQAYTRFFTRNRIRSQNTLEKLHSQQKAQIDRLTTNDIKRITRQLIKDKKGQEGNIGVINNVKGKMYCLKLGEISNFKEVNHYFYTSQYRRKYMRRQKEIGNNLTIQYLANIEQPKPKKINKCITQPTENILCNRLNQHHGQKNGQKNSIIGSRVTTQASQPQSWKQIQQLKIDEKLKEKINKYIFRSVEDQNNFYLKGQNKPCVRKLRKERRGYSVTRIL